MFVKLIKIILFTTLAIILSIVSLTLIKQAPLDKELVLLYNVIIALIVCINVCFLSKQRKSKKNNKEHFDGK